MTLDVQVLHKPNEDAPELLAKLLVPDVRVSWGDPGTPPEHDFHVLVAGRPSQQQLSASQNLHTLIIPFAGIPPETRDLVLRVKPGLHVYNLHHNALATAEMAVALMFAVSKHIIPGDRALRSNDWRIRYQPNQNFLLRGGRALIVGYGAVGREIARICVGLGMHVDAIRRRKTGGIDEEGISISAHSELDRLLPRCDALFIALPLTDQTRGMFDAARLNLLPEHCMLVNVARGPVIDEHALFKALESGSIAGAGIDVWFAYPKDEASHQNTPPAALPFHELENVVMSPHRAGGSRINDSLRLQHLAELINSLANRVEPPSRVDLVQGY